MSSPVARDEIVVVIPAYREHLSTVDRHALRQHAAFLAGYPVRVVAPEGLRLPAPLDGYPVERFAPAYFAGISGYNALMLSPEFYRRFERFRHLLVYQLDAIVLCDRLQEFCTLDYDYIGAPWFHDPERPESGLFLAGNGGLSLGRIEAFQRVLQSPRYTTGWPALNVLRILRSRFLVGWSAPRARLIARLKVARRARHGVGRYLATTRWNEDSFWSTTAQVFLPDYRPAPAAVGLDFAFERHPRSCHALNGGQLPFGVHAWDRYDPDFWRPHLLPLA
jgi:hypothetical protein